MKISIKTKLSLGVGLQFLFIVVSVVAGIVSVNLLTADTRNILRDNYDSVEYCRNMGMAVEDMGSMATAAQIFSINLDLQLHNITEVGEGELTEALAADYHAFQSDPEDPTLQARIRKHLHDITKLNMDAIHHKSEIALQSGRNANIIMGTVGTLSFMFALILVLNLPSSVADPIKEFTASIKQIANKNYAWRIDAQRGDEFGEMAQSFNSMAAKLEEYEHGNLAKMLFEKRRIEALINQMHNPIIGLNEDRQILFVNDAALSILNLTRQDLVGKSAVAAAQGNDLLRKLMQTIPSSEANKPAPLSIYADNKESYFEKEIVQVTMGSPGEAAEKYIGDVIILQNITPFKEMDAAKTNFIATVSHEFKTPISSIKMSLQLLLNDKIGPLNPEQKALVCGIQDDADRLLKITQTLLDLTQVESGHIQLTILATEAREIVEYALDATKVQAQQKGIRVAVADTTGGARILADKEKTAWVLTNLISNAIRYSHEGATVHVTAALLQDRLRLSVRDTGQGIAPQYQHKIFERYFRVPGTLTEGTGLGLAISKEFVEAQGGHIGMESALGAGSTFWIELQRER